MYRTIRWALPTFAFWALAITPAHAQAITYRLATTSDVFQNAFVIDGIGQTVSIRVYAEQSGGNPMGQDGGLRSLGMRLRFDTPIGSGVLNPFADVLDRGTPPMNFGQDITPNIPLGGSSTITGGNAFSVVINTASSPSLAIQPDSNRILIGTVRFTGLAPGSTAIRAEDPNNPGFPGGDFTTFNSFVGLDNLLVNGNAIITVVPEPTSLAFVSIAALGVLHRCRRRKAKVVST